MADNYLENKMAEHMAPRRPAPKQQRAATVETALARKRVLVCGDMHAVAAAVAGNLVRAGARVAVLGKADTPGARCFPEGACPRDAIALLIHDWHEIDMFIECGAAPGTAAALRDARAAIPAPLRNPAAPRHMSIHMENAPSCPAADIELSCADGADTADTARTALLLCAAPARLGIAARLKNNADGSV